RTAGSGPPFDVSVALRNRIMPQFQMSSPSPIGARISSSRDLLPKWNRVYFLLAGISLLTVVTSIGLTLRSAGLFMDSGEAGQDWFQRLSLHAELNAMLVVIVVVMGCGAGLQVIRLSRKLADLTESQAELQRIKQSFEDANRARTELLAQLSHDFRTPMAGI